MRHLFFFQHRRHKPITIISTESAMRLLAICKVCCENRKCHTTLTCRSVYCKLNVTDRPSRRTTDEWSQFSVAYRHQTWRVLRISVCHRLLAESAQPHVKPALIRIFCNSIQDQSIASDGIDASAPAAAPFKATEPAAAAAAAAAATATALYTSSA